MTKIVYGVTVRKGSYSTDAGHNAMFLRFGGVRFETADGRTTVLELDKEAWDRILVAYPRRTVAKSTKRPRRIA